MNLSVCVCSALSTFRMIPPGSPPPPPPRHHLQGVVSSHQAATWTSSVGKVGKYREILIDGERRGEVEEGEGGEREGD